MAHWQLGTSCRGWLRPRVRPAWVRLPFAQPSEPAERSSRSRAGHPGFADGLRLTKGLTGHTRIDGSLGWRSERRGPTGVSVSFPCGPLAPKAIRDTETTSGKLSRRVTGPEPACRPMAVRTSTRTARRRPRHRQPPRPRHHSRDPPIASRRATHDPPPLLTSHRSRHNCILSVADNIRPSAPPSS
jgi:hypothetical protein